MLFNPLPEDECFTLTHFIARGPDDSDVPLKSGYVWVSSEEPDLPAYADQYHDVPGRAPFPSPPLTYAVGTSRLTGDIFLGGGCIVTAVLILSCGLASF